MSARVLFTSYTGDWRGPTNSLLQLLIRIRDRFDVGVLLTGEGRFLDEVRRRGIPCHVFPDLSKWSIPSIVRVIRDHEYDLVYANNTHGSSRNAFLAAKLTRRPFVCHVRGMAWDQSWTRLGYLRFADAVIAVSDACANSVRRFTGADRLHRVYNGISLEDDPSPPETSTGSADAAVDLRAQIGAPSEAGIVLSVSHVCRRKGQLHAVRSMASVLREVPEAHLCVAGAVDREPEYTERVQREASELGVEDRVHLLGFRADVHRLLGEADVFLHTAVEDPHPRAVVEAMGAGLPVAAFRVDGVAETVADGRTGRLVDPGDVPGLARTVVQMLEDADLRRRMGGAGRERVEEHFTADATARHVARILDEVLEDEQGHVLA